MAELAKCPECGKLFAPTVGKDRCTDCLAARDFVQERIEDALRRTDQPTLETVVQLTGFEERIVRRAIEKSKVLRAQIDLGEPCARCGKRGAQAGSEFCFPCRFELYKVFGEAVDMLLPHLNHLHVDDAPTNATLGLGHAMAEKRARTRSARINLGPDTRVKR